MIDTHCHVDSSCYDDIDDVIIRAKESGVVRIIVNGYDRESNIEVLSLVKKYDIVYGALGFHPDFSSMINDEDYLFLENHINDDKIVAIGEIGLDYHYDDYDKNQEIDCFKRQIEIACKYNKPVIVHSRDAISDTYNILCEYNVKGSIHCYSGSLEMAKLFIKRGFLLGIGGVCTFKNSKNLIKVIESVDLNNILLETDSPYLTPEPFRGKRNEPMYVKNVAMKISSLKNVSFDTVVKCTYDNACGLFDFF